MESVITLAVVYRLYSVRSRHWVMIWSYQNAVQNVQKTTKTAAFMTWRRTRKITWSTQWPS